MFANFFMKKRAWYLLAVLAIIAISVLTYWLVHLYQEKLPQGYKQSDGIVSIQHWQMPSGLNVYFTAAPQLPMVDVRLVFNAGSAQDKNQLGIAALTNKLLLDGTAIKNADAIAQLFDDNAIQVATDIDRDFAIIKLRSLTDTQVLPEAVDLLSEILHTVAFPEVAFTREQQQLLTAIDYKQQDPEAIAQDLFFATLYGTHPYGSPVAGTKESVSRLTRKDVQQFYADHYVADKAVLVLVGDLSLAEAKKIATRLDGALQVGTAPQNPVVVAAAASKQGQKFNYPSTQTHLYIGQLGINRHSPDYFPLLVGNHILGGGTLVSLLFDEVRNKRGLAYSVSSYFLPLQANGVFVMSLQSRTEEAAKALQVVQDTLKTFVENGPSAEQLIAAQKNLAGGFPLRIANNGLIADYLAVIGFYDLPLDYLDTFAGKVNAVTLEQVKDAFARHVQPDNLLVVEVGKVE